MGFWLVLFLFIGFTVLGDLLRPKPKFGAPAASSLGDFQFPTAQEGRAIPYMVGKCKIDGPNVVWYGDLVSMAIKKKVKTGVFSSTKITTGYRYFLGAQMALCHGEVDRLDEIRFDDRPVPFTYRAHIIHPMLPTQIGWGSSQSGTTTVVAALASNDADETFVQSPDRGAGGVFSVRFSFGSPTGAATGWKLIVIAKKLGTIPPVPDDFLVVRSSTVAHVGMDWTGTTIYTSPTPWLANILTTDYVQYTYEFTPSQIATMQAEGVVSAGIYSNCFSPGPNMVERITEAYLLVPTDGTSNPVEIQINAESLFGGEEREGGIAGAIDFYRGTLTQTSNSYLENAVGAASGDALTPAEALAYVLSGRVPPVTHVPVSLPGYRGLCYAVLRQLYVGTSNYLKKMGYVVARYPNQLALTGGKENINDDANPAAVLYEILTNNRWGLALSSGQIDTASFLAAGNLLAAEDFGISMLFDSAASARDIMGEIQRHIDGVIYTDPATGLVKLNLIRASYGVADPLRLDVNNLTSVRIARPAWPDTKNVVKIRYVDRAANYTDRIAQEQDLANVQIRGGDVSEEEYDFRGVSRGEIAQEIAARELKTLSYPLAVLEMEANRAAWPIRPGDVVRVTWEPLGISDMACRVTRISTGDLIEGTIKIDAVEDIFGVQQTAYSPGATGWVDPIATPAGLGAVALVETPYALVVGPSRTVLTLGAQVNQAQLGYQVWSDPAGGTAYVLTSEVKELTPASLLYKELGFTDTSIIVTAAAGMALITAATNAEFAAGKNLVLVENELVAWQFITENTNGSWTLSGCVRGVADTTPTFHGIGSVVWFLTEGRGLTSESAYESDVTVAAKLLAFTALGIQLIGDVSATSLTTRSRAQRPYVPTDIKINALAYPYIVAAGDIAVTWEHRNRLSEWSYANAGNVVTPEAGTTYNLRFYGNSDNLLKTYSGLTGESQTWTTEVADAGARQDRVRIELEAVVGSLVSYQIFNFTVWRNMAERDWNRAIARPRPRRRPRPRVVSFTDDASDTI